MPKYFSSHKKQQHRSSIPRCCFLYLYYFSTFFPKFNETISKIAPNTEPSTNANKYIIGLLTAPTAIAKIPPCGAFDTAPKVILNAPATPLYRNNGGITRNGLLAANGIAPSVIKANPIT